MASQPDTTVTSRRAILGGIALAGAVAAAPSAATASLSADRQVWNRRVAEWRKLNALMNAERKWGACSRSNEDLKRLEYEMVAKHGTWQAAFASEEDGARCAAFNKESDALCAAEVANYVDPADRAAIALALTPAPDLDAMLLKIAVIEEHELDNMTWMTRDVMDVLREDAARF